MNRDQLLVGARPAERFSATAAKYVHDMVLT